MLELSKERISQILHEETAAKEEQSTILRGVYTRYMRLYEKYFADIHALNDEAVAELNKYHEETRSLIRYYYMDIPLETCMQLEEFDSKYGSKLLGSGWHDHLFAIYDEFKGSCENKEKKEEDVRAEFKKQALEAFYDVMDYIFRDDFGTGSQTAKDIVNNLKDMLFGE